MDPFLSVRIVILVVLVGLSAFFSSSETSLFSLNRAQAERIKLDKGKKGEQVWHLLRHPRELIMSILVGNELVNLAISVVGTSILVHLYGDTGKYLAIAIVTSIVLVFGEVIPKSLGVRNAEKFALKASSPLSAFSTAIYPIRVGLRLVVDGLLKCLEKKLSRLGGAEAFISEREFRTLVNIGKEEGVLHEEEKRLIEKVFDFGDATVTAAMTPRTDIFALDIDEDIPQVLSKLRENIYSCVPVYQETIDNIRGMINVKELLYHARMGPRDLRLSDLVQPLFIVPETKKVSELFHEFREGKAQFAIVIDEYGGVSGLVTLEDLLEKLVGEIMGEYDRKEHAFYPISKRAYCVAAMMPLEDFNRRLGTDFSDEQVETVGGYVLHLFGRVPRKGQKVEADGICFTVDEMRGPRIVKLLVEKKEG